MKLKFLEGKTTTERNKIIAAGLLGLVSIVALYLAFGRGFFGSTATNITVKTSPTPRPSVPVPATRKDSILPTAGEQDFVYQTTPVSYSPGNAYAPDAGRNIFAFYDPPPPCKDCPTPTPKPTPPPKPATPAPTPPILITFVSPENVYAGSRGFRLELNGDRITSDARIYFNQTELPTKFIGSTQLSAEVPANMIAREGPVQIIVQTPDGKIYSNQIMFNVQAPPRPAFQYIGMIGRKRYNNDTAYFTDAARPAPFGARLNDVVAGRFRLVDISEVEVVFEDTTLGFKHRVPITKSSSVSGVSAPIRGQPDGFVPFNPAGVPQNNPGIPNDIPRYVPPQPQQKQLQRPPDNKQDVDDDGDGGK